MHACNDSHTYMYIIKGAYLQCTLYMYMYMHVVNIIVMQLHV